MAERKKSDTSKSSRNTLLTAAEFGFPYENLTSSAVLMPVSQSNSSVLSEDVGEVDSFVGQNIPLSSALQPSFSLPQNINIPGPPVHPVSVQEPQRNRTSPNSALAAAPSESKPASAFFSGLSQFSNDPFAFTPTTAVLPQEARAPGLIGQPFNVATSSSTSVPLLPPGNVDIKPTVTPNTTQSATSSVPLYSSPSPVPQPRELPPVASLVPTPPVASCAPFNQNSTPPPPSVKSYPLPVSSLGSSGPGTNTYRLGTQRKLQYAQPPGLSVSASALPVFPSDSAPPTATDPPVGSGHSSFSDSFPASPAATAPQPPLPFVPIYPASTTPPTSSDPLVGTLHSSFSDSFPASSAAAPFVPTSLEGHSASKPVSVAAAATPPPTSPFIITSQSSSSYSSTPLLAASAHSAHTASLPPTLPHSHSSPSVASYFPTPIVAAATAMAATVAAANGPPQYQTPAQTPTDSSVLPPSFNNLSQGQPIYRPVYHHWFLKKEVESKVLWQPFSMSDSLSLEEAFTSTDIAPDTVVATDGGRYDVNILRRQRSAVYWEESPSEVRRCSWFFKGAIDSRYVPYEENVATRLEEEFKIAMTKNEWHHRVELANGETVVFHGPNVMVHFPQAATPDAWGNTPVPTRPRVVKRGVDEFNIEDGEPPKVDHLLFLVHGVGSACDLKFRTVEEVVDDFRTLSLQLVQSHFRTSSEQGIVNRIEVLPVSWHSTLHGEDTGIDQKLKFITLPSIPKLRHFTNDTLLDILFYTSPVYCQTIIHTVGKEINRLYDLFRSRHPEFQGGISLGGHSLGSLILFDLLCHQKQPQTPTPEKDDPATVPKEDNTEIPEEVALRDPSSLSTTKVPPHLRTLNHRVSYVMGNAGTGQPFITYPQLTFHPKAFFAMGSPIGMFVTVRGIDALGEDFKLPTCPGFFNIFHPFDPVAYRIETLVNPELSNLKPVVVPHHKGRKRMHLELRETMARVGADIKQKFLDSLRSTWNTVYQIAMFHRSDTNALEEEVDKVIEQQLHHEETESSHSEEPDPDVTVGQLNSGRRVDYVLQEAPLESFNEYLFALGSHVCYWESEDTMLMILKEVYSSMGISADSNVPQSNSIYDKPYSESVTPDLPSYQESLFATPSSSMSHFVGENTNSNIDAQGVLLGGDSSGHPSAPVAPIQALVGDPKIVGMDPTAPPSENKNLGPPPVSGFVRK